MRFYEEPPMLPMVHGCFYDEPNEPTIGNYQWYTVIGLSYYKFTAIAVAKSRPDQAEAQIVYGFGDQRWRG